MANQEAPPGQAGHPGRKRRQRWALWLIAVVLIAGIVVVLFVGLPALRRASDASGVADPITQPSSDREGTSVGARAPDFTLRSLAGQDVALSSFLGQAVILDFWASWCLPCQLTFPNLYAIWQELEDNGVSLVGVSLDRTQAAAASYIEQGNYGDMVALWQSRAASSAVAQAYGVQGIPHTLVIDRQGIILFRGHPARLTLEKVQELLDASRPSG